MVAEVDGDRVVEVLEALINTVSPVEAPSATRVLGSLRSLLATVKAARDDRDARRDAIRLIMQMYQGGMGSFQDAVLQDAHGVLPEQLEFGRLRNRLFEEARRELS